MSHPCESLHLTMMAMLLLCRCIIGYVDNNAKKLLTVLHTSTEGVEEFSAYFDTEDIAASLVYGLVRVVSEEHSSCLLNLYF